jgi:phosphatidylglycerophosphate synthase
MLKASGASGTASVKLGMVFSKIPFSPNTWTVLALLPAFLGFISLLYGELIIGALLFIVSGLVDAIDGAVARVTGAVSNLGAFLDGIIDRYVELLLYLGLLFYITNIYAPELLVPHVYWVVLLVSGALMPTFVRAYADHRGVVTEKEDLDRMGGMIERAERLGLIFAGMILGYFNTAFLIYLIAATAVLSHLTAVQRIRSVLVLAKKK